MSGHDERFERSGGVQVIEQFLELCGQPADGRTDDVAAVADEDLILPLAQHRRLRPLLLYLLNNLGERLSSAQAAKVVSVERKYFSKFFRRETGFYYSWWNRELRIRLARQLLSQKGRNIDAIALAVGYVDLTTFARAFKKCNGMAPKAYRRSRSSQRTSSKETAPVREDPAGVMTTNAEKKTTNADCSLPTDADASATYEANPLDRPLPKLLGMAAPLRKNGPRK